VRDKLIYYPTVTREPFRNQGRITRLVNSGRLFADIGLPPFDPARDRAMVCGSPAMIKDCCALARRARLPGFAVHRRPGRLRDRAGFRGQVGATDKSVVFASRRPPALKGASLAAVDSPATSRQFG
jgi:ferredoxin-NADP reductase